MDSMTLAATCGPAGGSPGADGFGGFELRRRGLGGRGAWGCGVAACGTVLERIVALAVCGAWAGGCCAGC